MSIRPGNMAIVVWGGGAMLLATSWAFVPQYFMPTLLLYFLLVVAGTGDLIRGLQISTRISVSMPESGNFIKHRHDVIRLNVKNADSHLKLEIAIDFPVQIEADSESIVISTDPENNTLLVDYPCTARERGRTVINSVHFASDSPLRLWRVFRVNNTPMQVKIYPDLRPEQKRLAGFFLHRNIAGLTEMRQIGKGREFEQLREYQSGDSFEDIHWKATARRARPVTKMYQLERTQEVYIIIDQSRLSARIVGNHQKHMTFNTSHLERYIIAAQLLAQVAERQGDRVGIAAFSDQVNCFLRASSGPAHHKACREMLFDLQPLPENPDFEELFTFLRMHLRKRSLLIFLTHLDDPLFAAQFTDHVRILSSHHLVLTATLTPENIRSITKTGEVQSLDQAYNALSAHMQWRSLQEIQKLLGHHGITMGMMNHATLTLELVERYMRIKKRQLL